MYGDLSQTGTSQCECSWCLACCTDNKLQNQFLNKLYLIHVIQTQGENDWKEQTSSYRFRSEANTIIYQLHPRANYNLSEPVSSFLNWCSG